MNIYVITLLVMVLLWFLLILFYSHILYRHKKISRQKRRLTIILAIVLTPILFYVVSYLFVIWFDTSFGFETIMDNAAIGGITYDTLLLAIFLITPLLITWGLTKIINRSAPHNYQVNKQQKPQ